MPTNASCTPGGAAHQNATRSSWCRPANVTKTLRTNQVGSPWLIFSVASGRARQSARSRPRASAADVPPDPAPPADPLPSPTRTSPPQHAELVALGVDEHVEPLVAPLPHVAL